MPLLYGNDVILESPDPMSKYNSANQSSSNLQKVAQKNTRASQLLQNCKQEVVRSPSSNVPKLDMKAVESIQTIRHAASKFLTTTSDEHHSHLGLNVSPDAVTEDIYDFDAKRDQPSYTLHKEAVESCKYPMSKDTMQQEEVTPLLQRLSDDEEFQLTSRVHAVRHKSVRIVEKQMVTRRSLSPSLNTLERQLQNSSSQMMNTSKSLDTLQSRTAPNVLEEGQYIALKPTPPSSGGAGAGPAVRTSFNRKSPQPPSTLSPKTLGRSSSQSNVMATPPSSQNKENMEANIRQTRGGRRYTNPVSPVVEETSEDVTSPPTLMQRPLPSRPTSNSFRRRPQPLSPTHTPATTVQVEYCIKSPERRKQTQTHSDASRCSSGLMSPGHAADIPHPSPKRKKGDRSITVSGFSKKLLVSLITAASKKRRRRNKNQPAFLVKLEQIPEDGSVVLTFPSWITRAAHVNVSPHIQLGPLLCNEKQIVVQEKSPERLLAELEYKEWLKSQVVVTHEDEDQRDNNASKLDDLMRAIHSQNNEQFKSLLNENKNIIFARDQNGNTALVAATLFGWKRGIKNLIKRGADLDAQNRFGNTSLHYASAFEEHSEIRRYLIRKQASATIRNERGICSCDTIGSC
jgi:hypothetical protein